MAAPPADRETRELFEAIDDLDRLLKNGDVAASLAARGLNASIALLVTSGLRAYAAGRKAEATDEFQAASEEIRDRLALADTRPEAKGNGHGDPS